eukprot:1583803-Prymnesium_polylepis.1
MPSPDPHRAHALATHALTARPSPCVPLLRPDPHPAFPFSRLTDERLVEMEALRQKFADELDRATEKSSKQGRVSLLFQVTTWPRPDATWPRLDAT